MTDIQVQKREILGKKVKALRSEGLIPAELYGRDLKNIHLEVLEKDFAKVYREAGESSVIKLKISAGGGSEKEGKDINVMIHDISKNPLTDEFLHVDFYQVKMDEKITASIPVKFIGEAQAVKEKNGVLVKAIQEIEIEALPGDLPQHIDVDISVLIDIGSSIYVKDINIGKNAKILVDPENVVATVTEQAKEEVVEAPISVEDVKVEGEEKKAEEAKEGEQEAGDKKRESKREEKK